jgi:hypothetical protein
VDVSKDWLIVEYDASKVTTQDMLRTIDQQKLTLTGKIVTDP